MTWLIVLAFVAWVLWALLAPSAAVLWKYRREIVAHLRHKPLA